MTECVARENIVLKDSIKISFYFYVDVQINNKCLHTLSFIAVTLHFKIVQTNKNNIIIHIYIIYERP